MKKDCRHCRQRFEIYPEDQAFYNEMSVPQPTLCHICRMQRRLSYRNERFLYHRKCDLSGKQIISCFSEDKPFKIYDIDEWWSDKWDPLDYGREFDFNRSFFEQFAQLRADVPRLALQQQQPMENSDYCNCCGNQKNCYLTFSSNNCEDCYFGLWVNNCRNCLDNINLLASELCYECVNCQDCYRLFFSRDSVNCSDSYFLRNCLGCRDCFGCTNQVNKQYMVFNKQKTKQDYQAFMSVLEMNSYAALEKIRSEASDFLNATFVKEFQGVEIQNSSGNYLRNCQNVFMSFDCSDAEDLRYCVCVQQSKSCMDHSHWGMGAERVYESQACGFNVFNLRFCNLCWLGCSDLTYCDHCFASKNSFGCVGLRRNEYCILNKQYTKGEYEALVPRIIEHMQKTASARGEPLQTEFGEFFPLSMSLFGYNETVAQDYFPVERDQALARGWQWHDEEPRAHSYLGPKYDLPDKIEDVDDAICGKILLCEISGRPYKIIPQELKFYREMGLPIPRKCPDERHKDRMALRNPRKLWERSCAKCGKTIQTSYSPDSSEQVYCEECYLKEVY